VINKYLSYLCQHKYEGSLDQYQDHFEEVYLK